MVFFDVINGLDDYRNDKRISGMLNGCKILNHIEFMNWYLPEESRFSQRTLLKYPESEEQRNKADKTIEIFARYVLQDLSISVCEGKIGNTYGRNAMNNLKNINNFDLLVVMDPSIKIVKSTKAEHQATKKLLSIIAFIIVEKGECQQSKRSLKSNTALIDRSDVYSVNLICRREDKPDKTSVKGVVLLGAYMYCIKNSPLIAIKDKIGILELAGAYTNLSGFFSYTKIGFDKDNTFYGNTCFADPGNLPMSVDINQHNNEDIIQMVCGDKKRVRVAINDDTGIYELGLPDKNNTAEVKAQAQIAKISRLKNMMVLDYDKMKAIDTKLLNAILNKSVSSLLLQTPKDKVVVVQNYLDMLKAKYKNNKNTTKADGNLSCTINGGVSR